MPRVNQAKKSSRGEPYPCRKCDKKIVNGETYYYWKNRYGPLMTQHVEHGPPRASELTQSKMSGVYAAVESVEDQLKAWSWSDGADDVGNALDEAANEVESVKSEYEDSLNNMPEGLQQGSTGQEIQEKIDALDEFVSTLQDASSEINDLELEDYEGATKEDKQEAFAEDVRNKAQEAIDSLSI